MAVTNQWVRAQFSACPGCGSVNGLRYTYEKCFKELENAASDGTACIDIYCNNCKLVMYEHTHSEHNFAVRTKMLASKWNALPRRAE